MKIDWARFLILFIRNLFLLKGKYRLCWRSLLAGLMLGSLPILIWSLGKKLIRRYHIGIIFILIMILPLKGIYLFCRPWIGLRLSIRLKVCLRKMYLRLLLLFLQPKQNETKCDFIYISTKLIFIIKFWVKIVITKGILAIKCWCKLF